MPNDNEAIRRRIVWIVGLLLLVGGAGWVGYQTATARRAEDARQREDDESLRMIRFQDSFQYLDEIGNKGDATIRAHCREVIKRLSAMEPGWYRMYRGMHPAPDWLTEGPAGG